jgi:hypothetical protein
MKTKLMIGMLLAAGSMFAQSRFSVGVNVDRNHGAYTQAYVSTGSDYNRYTRGNDDRRFDSRDRDRDRDDRRDYRAYDRDDYRAHDRDDYGRR